MGRYKVDPAGGHLYFCTCTVVAWHCLFIDKPYCDILIASLRHCRENKGIRLYAYVVMLNHLHLIIQPLEGIDLALVMRDFKRHTSSRLFEQLTEDGKKSHVRYFERAAELFRQDSEFKIWQDGYHPEEIHTESFFRQKLNYLHDNPVRKGHVVHPWEWRYSSARYYAEYQTEEGVLEVDFPEW